MIIGNKKKLGFEINKISDTDHLSEFIVYVNGKNICEYTDSKKNVIKSITWNNDELITFLNDSIRFLYEDEPFPIEVDGECASEMDNNARDFDSDDDDEFDKYYDALNDWTYNHSWMHARSGAIVPDLMFRVLNDKMELSWWTNYDEEDILFSNPYGFVLIDAEEYKNIITELFDSYNQIWN